MTITLSIPDELADRLAEAGDVSRRALKAFALAEYQAGRLTDSELRKLLGIATRYELDSFLTAHGILPNHTKADLERGRKSLPSQREDERKAADDLVVRFKAFRAGKTLGGLSIKELIAEGRR